MKKKIFIIAILIIGTVSFSFSQSSKIKRADKFYDSFAYVKAAEMYASLAERNIDLEHVTLRLADCYHKTGETEKAEQWYAKAVQQENIDSEIFYQYAQVLKENEKYKEAGIWMDKFYEANTEDSRAKEFIKKKNFLEQIKAEGDRSTIQNIDANTEMSDLGTSYYLDKLVFVSSRKEGAATKRYHAWNEKPFLNLYIADISEDGSLSDINPFSKKINSKYHEGPATFNNEGTVIYFTRNNFINGKFGKDDKGINNLKIYTAKFDGRTWNNIENIHINNDEYSVGHPSLSEDERQLYFVSDMPGGYGGTDIYRVSISEDGKHGEPENLGSLINTEGNEMFPFIYEDETLFFSSDGHAGLGGLDIFVAKANSNGDFVKMINAGIPVNSSKDDFSFLLASNGKTGYLSSNREGGKGDDDIYYFELLRPFPANYIAKGVAKDNSTGKLLSGVVVALYDDKGNVLEEVTTSEDGAYTFFIEQDKQYKVLAKKDKYLNGNNTIDTHSLKEKTEIEVDVLLKKYPGISLFCIISDKTDGKLLADVNVIIKDNIDGEEILNVVTGTEGDFRKALPEKKINDKLNYLITLKKKGYLTKEINYVKEITSPGEIPLHYDLDVLMNKVDVGMNLAKVIEINPIYFGFSKSDINSDAARELDKIVKLLKENPGIIIELGSHTDSRGSAESNMKLSNKRANASVAYIVNQGIDKSRMSGKGYGESKPNTAAKEWGNEFNYIPEGQVLTEKFIQSLLPDKEKFNTAHRLNRRTEFIIVKM